jgi:hypothetical protein
MLMPLLVIVSTLSQANVPKIQRPDVATVDRPDVVTVSPSLKKTLDELQKQCPTCATIDLKAGKQTWLTPKDQAHVMSQIDAPDGCTLTQWTLQASHDLKASLEKALSATELTEFQRKEPVSCERKAFAYYLDVAKQLLPKK